MTTPLQRSARYGVWLLIALVMLATLLVGLARFILPLTVDYRPFIEHELSTVVGRPVHLGSAKLDWLRLTPRLELTDVRVPPSAPTHQAVRVERLELVPDLLASVAAGELRWRNLTFVHADLPILRRADGRLVIAGLDHTDQREPDAGGLARLAALGDVTLSLHDAQIGWHDKLHHERYRFRGIDLTLSNSGVQHRLALDADLPTRLGQRLKVRMHFKGELGHPAGWRGRIYLDAREMRLASPPLRSMIQSIQVEEGTASAELWGEWREGRPARWLGALQARNVELRRPGRPQAARPLPRFDSVAGRFEWRRRTPGWSLDVASLQITANGRAWQRDSAAHLHREGAGNGARLQGSIAYARLQDVLPLVLAARQLPAELAARAVALQPVGEIRNVRFSLPLSDKGGRPTMTAKFRGLAFHGWQNLPGAAGLDGALSVAGAHGALDLYSTDLKVRTELVGGSLPLSQLRGVFQWCRIGDSWMLSSPRFALGNEALNVTGAGRVKLGEGSPWVGLDLAFKDGNARRLKRYLPRTLIKPKLFKWLNDAIVAGEIATGSLHFKGRLAAFPFADQQGAFHAQASINDATLNYKGGWPQAKDINGRLTFHNDTLQWQTGTATILDSRLEGGSIRIDDLHQVVVDIQGQAHGPLNDVLQYLRATPLLPPESYIAQHVSLNGPGALTLAIRLPLDKAMKAAGAHPRVSGKLKVMDGDMLLDKPDLRFRAIDGTFAFSPEGVSGDSIRARFQGRPIRIRARPGGQGTTRLLALGNLPIKPLIKRLNPLLVPSVSGDSDWQARLRLPFGRERADPSVELALQSDLAGVAIALPAPLKKAAGGPRPLKITTRLEQAQPHPLHIDYGDGLAANLIYTQGKVQRGALHINRGGAPLPESGFHVQADLPRLPATQWYQWYQKLTDQRGVGRSQDSSAIPLTRIDARIDRVDWSGFPLTDLDLKAKRIDQRWQAEIDSQQVQGHLELPRAPTLDNPVILGLQHLRIPIQRGSGLEQTALNPARIPPIRLSSHKLRFKDLDFTDLNLATEAVPDGMKLLYLQLSAPDLSLKGKGAWLRHGQGQTTRVQFKLASKDLGKALKHLGVDEALSDGEGDIEGMLQWPAAPYRFIFDGIHGSAKLNIQDGRLRAVDPGAGRLLGLFNLGEISRRLALNFSDLFKKGLSFDRIKGALALIGSDLYTGNLKLRGPSADITIQGRTGILARDYDQVITVTPHITSGLPVAGALLGGPVGGAAGLAVYLADKLSEQLGTDIDKVSQLRYHVTGSWEEPTIEPLIQAREKDKEKSLVAPGSGPGP